MKEAAVINGIKKASSYIYMDLLCLFALGYGWFILTYSSKEHGPRTPIRRQRKVEAALRLLSPSPPFFIQSSIPAYGHPHIHAGFTLLSQISLETPSQIQPEVSATSLSRITS